MIHENGPREIKLSGSTLSNRNEAVNLTPALALAVSTRSWNRNDV